MSQAVKATKTPKAPKATRTKKGAKNEIVSEDVASLYPHPILSTTDNDNIDTIENDIKDSPIDTVMSQPESQPDYETEDDDDEEEERQRLAYEAIQKKNAEKKKLKEFKEYKKDCKKDIEMYIDCQKAKLRAFCEKNDIELFLLNHNEDEALDLLLDSQYHQDELTHIQEKLFNEKNPAKPAKAEKVEKEPTDGKPKRKPATDKNRPITTEDYQKIFTRDTMIHHNKKMNAYGIFIHDEGVFYECDEDGKNRGQSFKILNHFTQHNIKTQNEKTGKDRTLQNQAYTECVFLSDEGAWLTCDKMNREAQLTAP